MSGSAGAGVSAVAAPAPARLHPHQSAVAGAALTGLYLVVFGPGVLLALRTLVTGHPASPPSGGWGVLAALEWDVFTVAVVAVVVLRWLPHHAPAVAGRLGTAGRIGTDRLLAGGAAFVVVAALSVWLDATITSDLHLSANANTQIGEGAAGFAVAAVACAAAAFTEELVLVALPVALLAGRSSRAVPLTLGVMAVLRLLPHLYYGWGAVFVVFWTVGAYAVFRWSGSVWPLVLGHVAYDWAAVVLHAAGR